MNRGQVSTVKNGLWFRDRSQSYKMVEFVKKNPKVR